MAKQVNIVYGDALFDLAVSEDRLDEYMQEVTQLREILEGNEDLVSFLNHPEIIKEEKMEVIGNVFSGRISAQMEGFLKIIVRKDRQKYLTDILSHFIHRVREYRGIGTARVSSATVLTEEQKQRLEEKLLAASGCRTLDMTYVTEPELLGGLVIRMNDRVLDSSIKTQIETLGRKLSGIHLS